MRKMGSSPGKTCNRLLGIACLTLLGVGLLWLFTLPAVAGSERGPSITGPIQGSRFAEEEFFFEDHANRCNAPGAGNRLHHGCPPAHRPASSVPSPTATGPIPATVWPGDPSHNYPFFATNVDLPSYDYVEEEFFIAGFANRYNTPALATGSVIDGGHPYKTRIVVRRPISPKRFNGTVVMEWVNVTTGSDTEIDWLQCHQHLIRAGYVWVGVSAQRVGVNALKTWNASRYGSLDVSQSGAIMDDSLSYDIFSQAAQALHNPVGVDPMGGLKAKWVIGTGDSQSASRLATYVNSIHPLAQVLDAVLLHSPLGNPIRTDLSLINLKVFKLLTETDVANPTASEAAIRQPDTDNFRTWEVAGSTHSDYNLLLNLGPVQVRDLAKIPSTYPNAGCALPERSRIPTYYVQAAIYDHMVRWLDQCIPPPTAPRITVSSVGPPAVIVRDSHGNALGGIRLSQHAVATATDSSVNSATSPSAAFFCSVWGSHIPFDDATLNALYHSHASYVSAVKHVTHENLEAGYILWPAALETIVHAAYADIPPN